MIDAEAFVGLLAKVGASVDELASTIVRCIQAEIPAYATLPRDRLEPGVRSNIQRAIDALARGWEPTPAEITASRALGEERAHQGVPLEALLRAHRIGVREVLARMQADARDEAIGAEVVLDLSTRAWAWADAVMLSAASGHRDVELTLAGQERQQRSHLMRGLLAGNWSELAHSGAAAAYGITAERRYLLVVARGAREALGQLEPRLSAAADRAGVSFLSAEIDHDLTVLVGGSASAARKVVDDGARGLHDSLVVALGERVPPAELMGASESTLLVLAAAAATGRREIVTLSDLALEVGVLARPEVGRMLATRYLEPLDAHGEFGEELLRSLTRWLDDGCRVDTAAAALFVHPNTLRHRLRRAEEILNADLGATACRMELWWALRARAMAGARGPGGPRRRTPDPAG